MTKIKEGIMLEEDIAWVFNPAVSGYVDFRTRGIVSRDMVLCIAAALARVGGKTCYLEAYEVKIKDGSICGLSIDSLETLVKSYIETMRRAKPSFAGERRRLFGSCLTAWFEEAKNNGMTIDLEITADIDFPEPLSKNQAWKDMYAFLGRDAEENLPWANIWWGFPDNIVARACNRTRQAVNTAKHKFMNQLLTREFVRHAEKHQPPNIAEIYFQKQYARHALANTVKKTVIRVPGEGTENAEDRAVMMDVAKELGISSLLVGAAANIPPERALDVVSLLPSSMTPDGEKAFLDYECKNSPLGTIRFIAKTRNMSFAEATRLLLSFLPDIREQVEPAIDRVLGIPRGSTWFMRRAHAILPDGIVVCRDLVRGPFQDAYRDEKARSRFCDIIAEIVTMGNIRSARVLAQPNVRECMDPVNFIANHIGGQESSVSAMRLLWARLGRGIRLLLWATSGISDSSLLHAETEKPEISPEKTAMFLVTGMGASMEAFFQDNKRKGAYAEAMSHGLTRAEALSPCMRVRKDALLSALEPERCAAIAKEAASYAEPYDRWLVSALSLVTEDENVPADARVKMLWPFIERAVDTLADEDLVADKGEGA